MRTRRQQGGFTLLEVLVAVFITGMISLGVWQVMNTLMASRDGIERVSGAFRDVQKTISLLERDLLQAVKRPVKDAYGERLPAMTSRVNNTALSLTRQGWRNPLGDRRSELQRVAWEYDELEEQLVRRYWPVLDRAQNTESREQVLLGKVSSLEVRFLEGTDQWRDEWPAGEGALAEAESETVLEMPMPRAVEVVIEHERFGTLRRVVMLGDTGRADDGQSNGSGAEQ